MPQSDPIQSPSGSTKRRIRRILRLLALLSILVAGIAAALVASDDPTRLRHIHLLIATALGVGLVLVGTGPLTVAFISNSSGHDDAAARPMYKENDKR